MDMANTQTLADVVFGSHGSVSKKELKNLYKASSTREVRKEIKSVVPGVRWAGIWGQVRTFFPDLFQIPATDILFYGWEKFQQVEKAIHPEQYRADERIQVPLHDKTYVSEHHPRIELYYHGKKVSELQFQFVLKLNFESLMLVFQHGELIELRPGKCEGTAELRLKKRTIFKRLLRRIEWPGSITINQGEREKEREFAGHRAKSSATGAPPYLPSVRRKRGVGCFLLIMSLFVVGSLGAFWVIQNWSACLWWLQH